jgi:hypothetical protein
MITPSRYIIALDPAQLHDWSALAAVKVEYQTPYSSSELKIYKLVNLERRQKLPYNIIVDWAVQAYNTPAFWPARSMGACTEEPTFVLDATGVGIAIKDALRQKGVRPRAASIVSGNSLNAETGIYHLGKARLIGKFLAAFDSGRVHINPNLPIYPQLERELISYRAEISSQGNAKFEAPPGEHDDLLFALALAVWWGEERRFI